MFLCLRLLWFPPGAATLWALAVAAVLVLLASVLRACRARAAAPAPGEPDRDLARLQAMETQLGCLVEEVKDYAIIQTDTQGVVVSWNPGAQRLLGWRAEEVLGRDVAILYPEEEVQAGKPWLDLERTRADGTFHEEGWRVRRDGSRFRADVALSAIQDPGGRITGYVRVTHDITARLEAEERLRTLARDLTDQMAIRTAELQESEARLQGIIRHAPAAIAVKGLDGRLLLVNRRAEALIGMCQAATPDLSAGQLFPADRLTRGREEDERVISRREESAVEEGVTLADGTRRDYLIQKFPLVDAAGRCWGLGVLATNITHRKEAEEARLQGSKREALGLLAGGMAHDFNNILGAMVGNVDLARLELGPLDHLAALEGLVARASRLVSQLLAYAGLGRDQVRRLDLNVEAEEMTRVLRASLPRQVVLMWAPEPGLPALEGDAGQVRQVILNLVANAAEALEPAGGLITIRTRREQVGAGERDGRGLPLEPGLHVALEVADDGPGMGAELLERIFDPFFTTRFSGRGLGLAEVQGILRGHRGGIRVRSAPGAGSTFTALFPACGGAVEVPERPAPEPQGRLTGTVLVVDDEDAVREVAVKALNRLGLETLEARDGVEALALHEAHWEAIRVILLDLTMPRMGGEETYRELRRAGSLAPIVLSSGFGPDQALQRFRGMALAGFLQKPYRLQALVDAVGRALEGGAPEARSGAPRELVAWIPEFETGLGSIDAQHKALVKAFNRLAAATEDGDPAQAMAELVEAMAAHAGEEERAMAQEGYPALGDHRAAHARVMGLFQDHAGRLRRGEGHLTPAALNLLEDALMDHMQVEDMDWARSRR